MTEQRLRMRRCSLLALLALMLALDSGEELPRPTAEVTAVSIHRPPGLTSALLGGYQMPRVPLPNQIHAPCIVNGRRLRGVAEVRGLCWVAFVNASYLTDPPTKRPCAEPAYDPPPEDPDRKACYLPVYNDKPDSPPFTAAR